MADYSEMTAGELLNELGDDARKWATAFGQRFTVSDDKGPVEDQEGLMLAWFANAIEHSHDVRTGSGSVVLPDGSA